ncbi:PDZ and LIM domain protein Zasp isoform X2 [Spodoptera litura]|uniref:PDZ and LIM domain protein Zasp isoform X2 n=1 Tax=Spodoptera litura TaxID=69820 RepID=A0A9J7DTF4_SPOLT|nr:PDZ and LIM domain protein Zasp isoform X2 [Spodoptera litura]
MAQLITVRLNKSDSQPLGFRLQGGKDFGTPLVVQKVNGGSAAERAGLQAGDALIRVNNTDVYLLRHQEAQDTIRAAGGNLELTVQRGGGTWRPTVTPTGSLPRPGSRPIGGTPTLVTNTSLKATPQPSRAFGSGHNNVAKPFGYMNGNDSVKSIVNKQYNTPVNMYSDKTIAETLSAQTEVLAGGVLGVNFKKNEKTYDAEKSAVFKVLQEEQNDPEPEPSHFYSRASVARAGTPCSLHRTHRSRSRTPRVVSTPQPAPPVARACAGTQTPQEQLAPEPPHRPSIPMGCHEVLPDGRIALGAPALPQPRDALPVVNDTPYCSDCNRYIIGVFVRIKDKNLHVECFKCSTCGTSLKNQGYYNLNGKLYCDIHAKLVARNNPPAPNLEPVTVPPGGRIPTNTYSTPLPPLATNNYTNGSSSLFSPSSNLSGPKPFGSSIGSAYSPSLSPRSAPMSPARPVVAPAPAPAPLAAPISAPQPAAPFAPTNEPLTTSSPHKTEFKSPAEERLIRKMAKMALNGYEIGIQRKIKPADHIQSMADKIQDTVVTKHPLNSDSIPPVENNTIKTLERGYKTHENIQSIGDKIKDTIRNNHPANESITKPNVLIPPPLPTTPVPTFNVHSTPLGHSINTNGEKKKYDTIPRTLNASLISDERLINNNDKSHNGSGYSSTEDLQKDKIENNYLGTLRKTGIEKSSFLNSMNGSNVANTNSDVKPELKFDTPYSNTLNKRKLFEKSDNLIPNNKVNEKINNASELNVSQKINNFDHTSKSENGVHQDDELIKSKEVSGQLYNNSLYTYKSPTNNKINTNGNEQSNDCVDKVEEIKSISDSDEKQNTEEEVVVRRRQKKNIRNDDGRRDSHIIARPLSTIQCADVAEGLYPVCHKCDKAITRGPFITALGRIWCPEHFICVNATCRRPLQDIGFVEENGQLYCEFCFEQYIAPACDKCHAKIKGDCLNAIGKHYHPECFNCVYCGKLFGNNPFFLEDGLPYCEADWNDLFTTKCFACGFPVEAGDRWVEALNNNYHSQCFNCTVCKKNLEGQSFFAKGGRPFCKTHAR